AAIPGANRGADDHVGRLALFQQRLQRAHLERASRPTTRQHECGIVAPARLASAHSAALSGACGRLLCLRHQLLIGMIELSHRRYPSRCAPLRLPEAAPRLSLLRATVRHRSVSIRYYEKYLVWFPLS